MTAPQPGARQFTVTGANLADEIEALLTRRPDLSRVRTARAAYKWSGGIEQLRKVEYPMPRTIERIRALVANPPAECIKKPMGAPRTGRRYRQTYTPRPRIVDASGHRIAAGVRRSKLLRAQARIDAGLPAGKAGQAMKLTQMALEAQHRETARLACPIEQAKTLLRRRGRVVFSASVYGGPKDRFIISGRGSETISTDELLAMAKRLAA